MPEENNVNFATAEELEELIEDFPEEEGYCDCLNVGFDGDYDDLLSLLYHSEEAYINSKYEYEKQEVDLWLDTNWEEIFTEKKPTQKDKEMYIKKCLLPLKFLRDTNKAGYENFKRMYELSLKYSLEVLR